MPFYTAPPRLAETPTFNSKAAKQTACLLRSCMVVNAKGRLGLQGRRMFIAAAFIACAGCASVPEREGEPLSIVEANRNFPRYTGREVTLEGHVGFQNEQPELWTSAVYAVHMFGWPRGENCIRLDFSGLAGGEQPVRGKYRLTGTIISAEHLPKSWGIACSSKRAFRVAKAVQISPF